VAGRPGKVAHASRTRTHTVRMKAHGSPRTPPLTSTSSSSAPDPTGLTLAAQLHSFGIRFRIIDKLLDRVRESRALAVQARTLEILQSVGLGDRLAERGRKSTRLAIHFGDRVAAVKLGDFGAADTRYPFILFVSQTETEAVLGEYLSSAGVVVERGVELVGFQSSDDGVRCVVRRRDGVQEQVHACYLVGCDGAHSSVRKGAGIPFKGGTYVEDFVLGDAEADGPLQPDTLHSFVGKRGVAMFFPLGTPASWRVIAMAPGTGRAASDAPMTSDLSIQELQAVDGATGGALRLRDPALLTHFRLHHRQTARYCTGRVFLAGDAAHIHSPVGAQGMNTGIQDAWNLGWKLARAARGRADPRLLDSYEAERWPVGRTLLRTTDRVFGMFTRAISPNPVALWFRREVIARVLPRVLGSRRLRAFAFRFVSELRIAYRRSPAVVEAEPSLRQGPKAGDRLPDARITRGGQPVYLQDALAGPRLHLLLCGDSGAWDPSQLADLATRFSDVLSVRRMTREPGPEGELTDASGEALRLLGVQGAAQYLVRPDGYIGFRCAGYDLQRVTEYLARWFPRSAENGRAP
jgi:2-polyprenyl-6-methoxyphenol hydroxylase-like FAD-dependent oxidoreductase